jgi:hypothetical protein
MQTKALLNKNKVFIPVVSLAFGYILLTLFLTLVLKYDFMQSDVLGYWQDSLAWHTPFHPYHVPGYPLILAFFRGITFNSLPPLFLMWFINFLSFLLSVILVYKIIYAITINETISLLASFLFGLWPLVGLTYTVDPLADIPVILLFLLGFYFLQKEKIAPAGIFFGLALITHKAIWIFVFLIIILDFFRRKEYFSKQNISLLILTGLPLIALWLFGSFYHQSFAWLISSNINAEIAPQSGLALFDGIIGTFQQGGIKGLVKGAFISMMLLISILSIFLSIKDHSTSRSWGIAISLAVLVYFIVLNSYEIWAAVRFSRLLVLPLAFSASSLIRDSFDWKKYKVTIIIVLILLFLSQFAYAWYLANVYFA